MPRRYWDYSAEVVGAARSANWEFYHHLSTYGAGITGVGIFLDDYRLDLFGLRWGNGFGQESMGLEVAQMDTCQLPDS